MENRTTTSDGTRSPNDVLVDPALRSIIGRAEAPARVPKLVQPPETMPGHTGLFEGVAAVFGSLRDGVAYATRMLGKYGEIYRWSFADMPMVVVWDADEIHRILKNEEQVWSTAMGWDALMFEGLDARTGNLGTLLSVDFEDHRAARKLVQPAFTLRAIEGYLAIAERSFTPTIRAWVDRGRVGFKAEVRTLLSRVAGEIFTGIRDPAALALVERALSDFWNGVMALTRNPWLSPTHRRARRGFATLLSTFLALAPERRKTGGPDLFSQLCASPENEGLEDEAIVRLFISIMFGAFDTTSAGMTNMAYLLAKHPDWQSRLRDEALGVDELDASTMKALKQHEWVWKETLRLMPVTSIIPRRALREARVGEHTVPAGTLVVPANGSVGRHPRWWTEPNRFDPERFSPERAEDRQHPGIFNPFGAGAHACIGMQLANMEMKLFWHELLRRCSFRLAKDYEARHMFTPLGIVSGDVALELQPL